MSETNEELRIGPWPVDADTYHADRICVSHGALEDFRESIPLYHGRHVAGTIPAKEPSAALSLGTAVHLAILQPDLFLATCVCLPFDDFRTKIAQTQRDVAQRQGKIVLTRDQDLVIAAMRAAVYGHAKASAALESVGHPEYAIRWRDLESGLWVRNLIDWYIPSKELLVNLKTAADPSPEGFARQVGQLGYHRSAALYMRGARQALGMSNPQELFIVVGKDPPHEVAVYILDIPTIDVAERQNRADLDDLARRRLTGDWSSRHAGLVEEIGLPKWLLMRE